MSAALPEPFYRGKVRDLYAAGPDAMVIVATDRVSAFDVVFDEPIPDKGRILTRISNRWFAALAAERAAGHSELDFESHLIATELDEFPEEFRIEAWRDRAVLVRKVERIDFECVVRGYLAGSGWKDYQKTGAVCGHALPAGLEQAQRLPAPIFTPATKAARGDHDENVSVAHMEASLGPELTRRLERASLAIYNFAAARMERAGIILCDTKFEFGRVGDQLYLIDEVLTPDSSRYWDAASYRTGISPPGYDKQYIRDFLESTDWDKSPPPPPLPPAVLERTAELYRTIEGRIDRALASGPES